MKSLVIGKGQVGEAIYENIKIAHESYIRDIEPFACEGVEVLHICFPYSASFVDHVKKYVEEYKPKLVIVNSSVLVGTTKKLGKEFVYSPVRGRHPKLVKEVKDYIKVVASENLASVKMAGNYFEKCGLDVYESIDPTGVELMKLLSNVHMGVEILWRQEVERMLKAFKVSPALYENWEQQYLNGYFRTGDFNLIRSTMNPGPIGGHCILDCVDILSKNFASKLLDLIVESNNKVLSDLATTKEGRETTTPTGGKNENRSQLEEMAGTSVLTTK